MLEEHQPAVIMPSAATMGRDHTRVWGPGTGGDWRLRRERNLSAGNPDATAQGSTAGLGSGEES
jgi:hypothetical protein